jgi:hypothetical protein
VCIYVFSLIRNVHRCAHLTVTFSHTPETGRPLYITCDIGSSGGLWNWNMDLFICLPSSRSLPWRTHKQKQAPSPWQLRSPQGLPLLSTAVFSWEVPLVKYFRCVKWKPIQVKCLVTALRLRMENILKKQYDALPCSNYTSSGSCMSTQQIIYIHILITEKIN